MKDVQQSSLLKCLVKLQPLSVKDMQQTSSKSYVKTQKTWSQFVKLNVKSSLGSNKKFKCQFCSRIYSTENGQYKYVHTHYQGRYKCNTCGKCFQYPYILKNHAVLHKKLLPVKCYFPGCLKRYAMSAALTNHKLTHHKRKWKCSVCKFSTSTIHYLNQHMSWTHGPALKARCGLIFTWSHQCQQHQSCCKKCKKINKKIKLSI